MARDISMEAAGVWVLFSSWHRLWLSRCLVVIRREPCRCGAGWVEASGRRHCQAYEASGTQELTGVLLHGSQALDGQEAPTFA